MSTYIDSKKFKNEDIMEQYYDIHTEQLWIITQSSDVYTLFNHNQNKKIGTSKDIMKLYEKIPDYFTTRGGD